MWGSGEEVGDTPKKEPGLSQSWGGGLVGAVGEQKGKRRRQPQQE